MVKKIKKKVFKGWVTVYPENILKWTNLSRLGGSDWLKFFAMVFKTKAAALTEPENSWRKMFLPVKPKRVTITIEVQDDKED